MDIHLGPFEGNSLPSLARLVGKVLKVEGTQAILELGGQRFDVELTIPLQEGDRIMATLSRDGKSLVVKPSPLPQMPAETLTDFDLPAILKDWSLKGAEPAARALLSATGQLEEKPLKRFMALSADLPPEKLDAAAALFARKLPLTRETLEWANPKTFGALQAKLRNLPQAEQEALLGILERFRFTSEKGVRALSQAVEAPEALLARGKEAGDNPTALLGKLTQEPGAIGQWAAELQGILRNAQLLTGTPRVPFWFEGGEGHLEAEGNRVTIGLQLEELGNVRITLMQVEGLLSCLVVPELPEVADWLALHQGVLEEGLVKQGYRAQVRIKAGAVPSSPDHVDLRL